MLDFKKTDCENGSFSRRFPKMKENALLKVNAQYIQDFIFHFYIGHFSPLPEFWDRPPPPLVIRNHLRIYSPFPICPFCKITLSGRGFVFADNPTRSSYAEGKFMRPEIRPSLYGW